MTPFTSLVVGIIRSIPPGKVMTYGQIAACAGSPRSARQVVRILHSMSHTHNLPWHRVVNAAGRIAIPSDEGVFLQITQLEEEGVEISGRGQIDLDRYRHVPEPQV
jgi:methylated-DNA-protein-cysteine methyltransferase-like protein